MNLLGRPVQDPLMHICEVCLLPVLIYGRMVGGLTHTHTHTHTHTCTHTHTHTHTHRSDAAMPSVVTVPNELWGCVLDVRRGSRRLKKHQWEMCISAPMEEGGEGVGRGGVGREGGVGWGEREGWVGEGGRGGLGREGGVGWGGREAWVGEGGVGGLEREGGVGWRGREGGVGWGGRGGLEREGGRGGLGRGREGWAGEGGREGWVGEGGREGWVGEGGREGGR